MLSIVGGATSIFLSFLLPLLFPNPDIIALLLIFLFQIVIFIGGILTVVGAILYFMDILWASIIILTGGLMGVNILSLWGGSWALSDWRQTMRNQKADAKSGLFRKAEKVVCDYLEENKGKAFTASSLYKRCVKANKLNLSMTETNQMLQDLYVNGKFSLNTKENITYYFVS